MLTICQKNCPFTIYGQFFLDKIGFDTFTNQESAIPGCSDRIKIVPFNSGFLKCKSDYLICTV
jgi:hypothetical protein